MVKKGKLNDSERDLIAILHSQGISARDIGNKLGRNHTTVSRELTRNRFGTNYVAIHAQSLATKRKQDANKRHPLKSKQIYSYVLEKLRFGWSPEEISGRLTLDNPQLSICTETIYQFIYAAENKHKQLWEYLPRKQKKRRKKQGRSVHKSRIPDRVSIHDRPQIADQRIELGHWEGDTVEGKGHKDGIHTEVERVSRYMLAIKVPAITSAQTISVQLAMFKTLPDFLRKSTTLDNGKENHMHTGLRQLGMLVFFCDPYSSWQRGTNEYHNGLLRRYLPKKTSFANLSQEELDDIVEEINNRPRKVLHFKTPVEILGGAIQLRM